MSASSILRERLVQEIEKLPEVRLREVLDFKELRGKLQDKPMISFTDLTSMVVMTQGTL